MRLDDLAQGSKGSWAGSEIGAAAAAHLVLLTGVGNDEAQAFYGALGYRGWALAMRKGVDW